ncbi:Interferon-induced helicase C domain containing protein 1 [Dissostichus eleginoides]|uniref:Interferon-induced helicase C domain containing protein 1 n=1 Tax=Dissostichus eleginoides TaxID=100907 RepID=A0AAD9F0Q9_DISEL|nr:Interferon-induced helicase C domain containing protein 1 [Dissostichus eleginoides]
MTSGNKSLLSAGVPTLDSTLEDLRLIPQPRLDGYHQHERLITKKVYISHHSPNVILSWTKTKGSTELQEL